MSIKNKTRNSKVNIKAKNSQKILLVEDEVNIGSTLIDFLIQEGYNMSWAQTAQESEDQFKYRSFDLTLLDVGLPDGSGFEVAQKLKKIHPNTPVIFLTAFGEAEDRIHGLELGADDYIVKPFSMRELSLRIKIILKRKTLSTTSESVQLGKASIDFSKFQATVKNITTPLSQKECALLKLLYERKEMVVSRDIILNMVWSEDEFPNERTVDNFIVRLRKIIEEDPKKPQIIRSIRGIGYKLMETNL